MIDHIWTVVCSNVVIDQDTNNVSIFNILEQINVPGEVVQQNEALPIGVEVVSLWVRSELSTPEKGDSRLTLVAPNGEVLKSTESDIDLTRYERLRARGLFQSLPFRGNGVYRFVVELKGEDNNWSQVASIPLKIIIVHKERRAETTPA